MQFRAESLAAIQAIDTMPKVELASPQQAHAGVRRDFVNGILNSRSEINSNLVDLAINPYKPPANPNKQHFD